MNRDNLLKLCLLQSLVTESWAIVSEIYLLSENIYIGATWSVGKCNSIVGPKHHLTDGTVPQQTYTHSLQIGYNPLILSPNSKSVEQINTA